MNLRDEFSEELLPENSYIVEQGVLGLFGVIALAGFIGWVIAFEPVAGSFKPVYGDSSTVGGLSMFVFGSGTGGFAVSLNLFFNPVVSRQRAVKVISVYLPMLILLSALVAAQAFHPSLALVYLALLCTSGIGYSLLHGSLSW